MCGNHPQSVKVRNMTQVVAECCYACKIVSLNKALAPDLAHPPQPTHNVNPWAPTSSEGGLVEWAGEHCTGFALRGSNVEARESRMVHIRSWCASGLLMRCARHSPGLTQITLLYQRVLDVIPVS